MCERDPERVERNQKRARKKRAANYYAAEIERRRKFADADRDKHDAVLVRRNDAQKIRRAADADFVASQRAAARRYHHTRKEDPAYQASRLEARRRYMDRLRGDPNRYAAYLERVRDGRRRRILEKLMRNIEE
jgi:hypothetical protein